VPMRENNASRPSRSTGSTRVFATLAVARFVDFSTAQGQGRSIGHLAQHQDWWHDFLMDATLVMGQQGRLVIPAAVRAALGLVPGDRLHLHVAGQRLVLERQQDAVAELRAMAGDVTESRSFVEELLAERRLAAAAE
jgi:antitoxin PrlF